jgi:NAD(P)-dependent dehydrogenase (short-subunit alcohol dehydrogenase family)
MQSTPFDLTGKVAVVTGSSRGIGRSSAELLAKLGAKVVISSRKADACEAAAEGIRRAGGDAHVIPCNISRKGEVEALIAGSIKHYGKIDILVCNAAVNPYYGPLLDISDEASTRSWAPTSRATSGCAASRSRRWPNAAMARW